MGIKKTGLLFAVTLLLLPLTGCWDQRELNDRLFDLGSGIDRLDDGKILLIGQFMIPLESKGTGAGEKKSYFIEAGTGKTLPESIFDLQIKLSRKITRGHRHNIYFGEDTAKAGISEIMDSITRDPDSRLKTDIWVVKGKNALEFMQMSYPLEKMPVIATSKIRETIGKKIGNSLLEFLIESNAEGSGPTLPAIDIQYDSKLKKKTFRIYGRAILNRKQQLVGYFDAMESAYRLWVVKETKRMPVTVPLSSNRKETFSVEIERTRCKVHTQVEGDRVKIDVNLNGNATIQESNTPLELRNVENLRKYEEELNSHIEKAVSNMIQKAQKQFKIDVFHFGRAISRQHPREWENLNSRWEQGFTDAQITVHSRVKIKRIGLQGPPPYIQ
jgi:spore germination protein KC